MNKRDLPALKAAIREEVRSRLRHVNARERATAGERICSFIRQWPAFVEARCVAAYLALPDEPGLDHLFRAGKIWCVPALDAAGEIYRWRPYAPGEPLLTGRDGVRQPAEKKKMANGEIDLFLVPGRAFTRDGTRVGRGGGHYDRLLAGPSRKAPALGVLFNCQLFDALPANSLDVRMEALVTEEIGVMKTISNQNENK